MPVTIRGLEVIHCGLTIIEPRLDQAATRIAGRKEAAAASEMHEGALI